MDRIVYNWIMSRSQWQVQEAKADLSALIRAAEEDGPQTITRNGKAVAIMLSLAAYQKLRRSAVASHASLLDFFSSWPELELPERDRTDLGRRVEI